MSVYHRLWRKALGHEVITYPSFWGWNSKALFKSKRSQVHEYVIGFIEKLWTNPCFGKILEPYKPKTWVGRLTKSPMRIKRGNLF